MFWNPLPLGRSRPAVKGRLEMSDSDMKRELGCGMGSENYAALTELFEQGRDKLVRVALHMMRNREEAEDVVQEAALRAFVKLHSFRGESQIGTWTTAIVRHSAINRLRSPSRRRELSLDNPMTDHQDVFACILSDASGSPEQHCIQHELHEIVRSEIEGLKCSYRAAIQLCDLEGHSYIEAAEALNLNLPNFKARLRRGRQILQRRLRDRLLAAEKVPSAA
jgi:RNA polymerase sigma-70 factor, ECF subfamily